MKKYAFLWLSLCVCLGLCACGKTQEATTEPTAMPGTTAAQPAAEMTAATTEETTVPGTQPPRVAGPERIEGTAVTIENVSVEYLTELPGNIRSSTTYSVCDFKEEFVLNESQVYAQIHFTITNKTADEIKIADIHDEFLVELIYDNRVVYSADTSSWCFFKSGAKTAVVSNMMSIGSVTLAPLTTQDVVVYIPCAKEISTELDKYLIVVFTSNYSGYENLEFIIR